VYRYEGLKRVFEPNATHATNFPIYELNEFTNLRKLQPIGTELSYPAEIEFLRFKLKKNE